MHLERFSDAPCTIATRSQKISARIEWQFLQRRVHYERLRSSVCTCTWGGNDIDPFPRHVSFSAVSLLFMGYFLFIRIAQISCVHTLLPFHFVSPNASPAPRFWRSRQIWLNTQGTFVFSLFSLRKKDVSHLGWAAHKSVDQFWRSFLCLTLILLRHFLHLAGYHRLSPNALLRSSRHALWVSGRKLLFASYNL
jgi:hypothetical protein